jgi:hypothetical protein
VLAPHHAVNAELGQGGGAAERSEDLLVFVVRDAVFSEKFRCDLGFLGSVYGHGGESLFSHACAGFHGHHVGNLRCMSHKSTLTAMIQQYLARIKRLSSRYKQSQVGTADTHVHGYILSRWSVVINLLFIHDYSLIRFLHVGLSEPEFERRFREDPELKRLRRSWIPGMRIGVLTANRDYLMLLHFYLGWRSTKRFAAIIDRMLALLNDLGAQPFDSKCEVCRTTVVKNAIYIDKVPSYLCNDCQRALVEEQAKAEERYDQQFVDWHRATGAGLACSLPVMVIWTMLMYGISSLKGDFLFLIYYLAASGVAGALIGFATGYGSVRVTWGVRLLAGSIGSVASVLGAAMLFALLLSKQDGDPFSIRLVENVISNMPELLVENPFYGFAAVTGFLAAIGGAVAACRRPNLQPMIQRTQTTALDDSTALTTLSLK